MILVPTAELTYYRTAERPDVELWLLGPDGTLLNLATGYTFEFKLGTPGSAAVFTKTTGIAGAAGSGTETSGAPNVVITFATDELASVAARAYTWQLRATAGGLDRFWQGIFLLRDVIT